MPKPPQDSAFELEGMVSTLTVLRLQKDDLSAIEAQLRSKVEALPGFFQDAPVAFDLSDVDGDENADPPGEPCAIALEALVRIAREAGLSPIGVRNPTVARRAEAQRAGIGILRGGPRARRETERSDGGPSVAAPADGRDRRGGPGDRRGEPAPGLPGYVTLRQPLRGGQVVYAEQADAIVLAPVNSGAELIADGNIHVYGPLRGRALAGAHGDERARIFCQSLEADLVSIAGTYLRAEELPEAHRGKPVQISLEDGQLVIRPLGG